MIEAVGVYSSAIKGINVTISPTKIVEIRLTSHNDNLTDGVRYKITAELEVSYHKDREPHFRARLLSSGTAPENVPDYARYRGVFRINEGAGGMREKMGGELLFYRGDAFSTDLRSVALDKTSGWVTVAVPKCVSAYPYRPDDLLYVDGKLYHKIRNVNGAQAYELCVRAEVCHKVDGTEYWGRVRVAHRYTGKSGGTAEPVDAEDNAEE